MSTFLIMFIAFNFILAGVGLYNIEKPLTTTQLLSNIFNMLTCIFRPDLPCVHLLLDCLRWGVVGIEQDM